MNEYRRYLVTTLMNSYTDLENYKEELNGLDRTNPANDERISELERRIRGTEPAIERLRSVRDAYQRSDEIRNNGRRIGDLFILTPEEADNYQQSYNLIQEWEEGVKNIVNIQRTEETSSEDSQDSLTAEEYLYQTLNEDRARIAEYTQRLEEEQAKGDQADQEEINRLSTNIRRLQRGIDFKESIENAYTARNQMIAEAGNENNIPDELKDRYETLNRTIETWEMRFPERETTRSNPGELTAEEYLYQTLNEDRDRIAEYTQRLEEEQAKGDQADQEEINRLSTNIRRLQRGIDFREGIENAYTARNEILKGVNGENNLPEQLQPIYDALNKTIKTWEMRFPELTKSKNNNDEKETLKYEDLPDELKFKPASDSDLNKNNPERFGFKPAEDLDKNESEEFGFKPDNDLEDNKSEIKIKKGYREIINELMDGLTNIESKDGKKYKASNIKVMSSFINDIRNGNWVYNVVSIVPAIVKAPVRLITKLVSQITYRKEAKKEAKILKERINDLSEEDLETLIQEYTTNRRHEYGSRNTLLQVLLDERIREHLRDKRSKLNNTAANQYIELFSNAKSIININEKLESDKLTEEQRKALLEQKERILDGKCGLIRSFFKNRDKADRILNDGEHGFSETTRSILSSLNRIGLRFSKGEENPELRDKLATLENQLNTALAFNNNEDALLAFADLEGVIAMNTTTRRTILGKIEDGPTSHRPLAEDVDFRDDMFIRNLLTTITVTAGAYSVINGIKVSSINAKNRAEVARANQEYTQYMDTVHNSGKTLYDHAEQFNNGQLQMSREGILTYGTGLERRSLDLSDWNFDAAYHANDAQAHTLYNNLYDATSLTQQTIIDKLNSGAISQADALQQLSSVNDNVQHALQEFTHTYAPELAEYAASHPNFDLHGLQETVFQISQNPNAISVMNDAMLQSVKIGDVLQNLTPVQIANMQQLPDTILGPLVTTIGATALANNVSREAEYQSSRTGYEQLSDIAREYGESRPELQIEETIQTEEQEQHEQNEESKESVKTEEQEQHEQNEESKESVKTEEQEQPEKDDEPIKIEGQEQHEQNEESVQVENSGRRSRR